MLEAGIGVSALNPKRSLISCGENGLFSFGPGAAAFGGSGLVGGDGAGSDGAVGLWLPAAGSDSSSARNDSQAESRSDQYKASAVK